MIIGFGFGSPLIALLMLIITASLSYFIFKAVRGGRQRYADNSYRDNYIDVDPDKSNEEMKAEMRDYYYEQRRNARQMMQEYDLTDKEIEDRIDEEIKNRN